MKGAHIRQRLIALESPITQEGLSIKADALNRVYLGMTAADIERKAINSSQDEERITREVVEIMKGEDAQGYDKSYLEGLHFMLHQPEFSRNQRILDIMELLEHRTMLGSILPADSAEDEVRVVIGSENKAEVARDCSLVIGHYGVAGEVQGTLVVVGPTRMAYPRVIATVTHLSALLSGLIAELYGVNCQRRSQRNMN
jgi:heat-inducible transcriptional repressor